MNPEELHQFVEGQIARCNYVQVGFYLRAQVGDLLTEHACFAHFAAQKNLPDVCTEGVVTVMRNLREIMIKVRLGIGGKEPDAVIYALQALATDAAAQAQLFLEKLGCTEEAPYVELGNIKDIIKSIRSVFTSGIS